MKNTMKSLAIWYRNMISIYFPISSNKQIQEKPLESYQNQSFSGGTCVAGPRGVRHTRIWLFVSFVLVLQI